MAYHINLSDISISEYSKKLHKGYLPPSRNLLLDDIEQKFQLIKNCGIENVQELQATLKTKPKLSDFAKRSGLPADYLVILIREINSTLPKPNKLKDFPEISMEIVEKLESLGIKHTLHLYDRIKSVSARKELENETGLNFESILYLAKLTDLSRVKWVNHTFAYMLYDAGYQSVKDLTKADAVELHKAIADLNNKRKFFKGNIGLNDIRICINAAKEVSQEVEY